MTIIFKSNIVGIIRYIHCGIYKYIKKYIIIKAMENKSYKYDRQ